MQLKELAKKPKLEKVIVDDEKIIELYGEPLEFFMWDRQELPTYLKLSQMREDELAIFNIVKEVILDENGNQVLNDGELLPIEITVPVLEAAFKHLGNRIPQTSV